MVRLAPSLEYWLYTNHPEILSPILFGRTELFTDDMTREYIEWCTTEEGKQYLKGGSKYREEL